MPENDLLAKYTKPVDAQFYTKRHKVVRDLVHEYIHLSTFEVSIVDTLQFQRLRDIKQVTAAYVFPNANHTRFEHSLGTFELTRRAIDAVNENGLFANKIAGCADAIHPSLVFSTLLAALLHDIGHSPFSHLGEMQFDKNELRRRLKEKLLLSRGVAGEELFCEQRIETFLNKGAEHEILSCLVIIEKLWPSLQKHKYKDNGKEATLNLEHICRCILGIPYKELSDLPQFDSPMVSEVDRRIANFCVSLVNWNTFDMDSLVYIMRDTLYCGLSSAKIDTQRLFSSMYISESGDGCPVFKRQATSVLSDIINAKNSDYLYAIYHHAALYSDFMYAFLFRRFKNDQLYNMNEFFTANAIINDMVSDSDVNAMLKKRYKDFIDMINRNEWNSEEEEKHIRRAHDLLTRLFTRDFLKPFWKDIIELADFKQRLFVKTGKPDAFDRISDCVCKGPLAESFRSEVVPAIVEMANRTHKHKACVMPQELKQHEMFMVAVQQKWLEKTNVTSLSIYIRENEVRNPTRFGGSSPYEYKPMQLKDVLPLSPYSEHYPMQGFYIYVKPIEATNIRVEHAYYETLEKISVIALEHFANDTTGVIDKFLTSGGSEKKELGNKIYEDLWEIVKRELELDC